LQTENHFNEWLNILFRICARLPGGSTGSLNAGEEQFMPYPKDRETELKPMTPLAK